MLSQATDHETHLYGFVWDHDREASQSSYFGRITVE